jgi:hypothetical protein
MTQITLNIEDDKLNSFLAFIKTLDYVSLENNRETTINYPTMTDKQIIDRVAITNIEIEQGKFISQDQLIQKMKNW